MASTSNIRKGKHEATARRSQARPTMEPEDIDIDDNICADCGARVDPSREPTFAITPEVILCMACSTRRGGAWDGAQEKWTAAPRLEDLPLGSLEDRPTP
jgi:hypothetical protein